MFEKAVAITLSIIVLGLGGLIVYLTVKGWDKHVATVREGRVEKPVEAVVKPKRVAKKSPAKKKRRR